MTGKTTLTIIKPLAVETNCTGKILSLILENGFKIIAMKMIHLSTVTAGAFYAVHLGKPFYEGLVKSMTTGPIVVAILEKANAVEEYRKLMGSTDPEQASQGTLRKLFGVSIQKNAVHGSDSDDNAKQESDFFFSKLERF